MGEQPLQGQGPEQWGPLAGTQFPPRPTKWLDQVALGLPCKPPNLPAPEGWAGLAAGQGPGRGQGVEEGGRATNPGLAWLVGTWWVDGLQKAGPGAGASAGPPVWPAPAPSSPRPRPGCAHPVYLRGRGPGTAQPPRALAVPTSRPGPLLPAVASVRLRWGGVRGQRVGEPPGLSCHPAKPPEPGIVQHKGAAWVLRSQEPAPAPPHSRPPPPTHSRPYTLTPAPHCIPSQGLPSIGGETKPVHANQSH